MSGNTDGNEALKQQITSRHIEAAEKPTSGGSDKSTVSGPSARTPARASKGFVSRARSALLDGMNSNSPDVRAEAAADRLAEKMAGTDEMAEHFPSTPSRLPSSDARAR